MKKIWLTTFLIITLILPCLSQCKYKIETIINTNTQKIILIKKLCGFYGWKESFSFYILKKNENFYFDGTVSREYSRKFEIPKTSPIVFLFEDTIRITLFPVEKKNINESGYFWSNSGEVLYEVSYDQLKFLSCNIPREIHLHYFSDQINPKFTDKYGAYWPLYYKLKSHYNRFIKVLQCALSLQ